LQPARLLGEPRCGANPELLVPKAALEGRLPHSFGLFGGY
jgi:hypothetical protein